MFGKKKRTGIPVMHYEGLDFPQDILCQIEILDNTFVITRVKPETRITLPLSQVKAFSAVEEARFMLKYHGEAATTSKAKGIEKFYLVVDYTSKNGTAERLAFWGTAFEYGKFLDLQRMELTGKQEYSL